MTRRSKSRSEAPTAQQRRILNYIVSFLSVEGRPPSLDEIRAHMKLSAVSTVHEHVTQLVDKGYLSRQWNHTRSLELTEDLGVSRAAVLVPHYGRLLADRPFPPRGSEEEIAVPASLVGSGACFAVTAADDSFSAENIYAGDTLVIEKTDEVAGGAWSLVESNRGVELISGDGIPGGRVVGRVVGLIRKLA